MKSYSTKKLIIYAMFVAMFFVLSIYGTVNLGNMKITLQNIPLLMAAFLFGPLEGAVVGGLGMLLNQLLSQYGITVTTPLWILPHIICGAYVGALSHRKKFSIDNKFIVASIIISSLLILTIFNTLALFIDSKIFGYYSAPFVFGSLLMRIITAVVSGSIYTLILPPIIKKLEKHYGL